MDPVMQAMEDFFGELRRLSDDGSLELTKLKALLELSIPDISDEVTESLEWLGHSSLSKVSEDEHLRVALTLLAGGVYVGVRVGR